MKRFIIIGAILAGAAVCVLLAHQEVFTSTSTGVGVGSGSKYMIIKVDTRTGDVKSKKNEDDEEATEVPKQEFNALKAQGKLKNVATIFHTQSSPGCVIIVLFGNAYKICY